MFVSYAQNFEDVLLWRVLKNVTNGTYIDVGAQDPVVDSVSFAFYERGWRGVHVEPVQQYADALRAARPDETVIQAAVAERGGTLNLFVIPGTGLSTADAEIAERHRDVGFQLSVAVVPCITLEALLSPFSDREVHWLKIDVEGLEHQVLSGWGSLGSLPWIVVVECTLPNTQIPRYERWEPLLLDRGYQFAYFDGLNRFYVAPAHQELRPLLSTGANLFDDFAISTTQGFARHLNQCLADAERSVAEGTHERLRADDLTRALEAARSRIGELEQDLRALDAQAERSRTERTAEQTRHSLHLDQLLHHSIRLSGQLESALRAEREAFARAVTFEDRFLSVGRQLESVSQERREAFEARDRALANQTRELAAHAAAVARLETQVESFQVRLAAMREAQALSAVREREYLVRAQDSETTIAVLTRDLAQERERGAAVGAQLAASAREIMAIRGQWSFRFCQWFGGRRPVQSQTGADSALAAAPSETPPEVLPNVTGIPAMHDSATYKPANLEELIYDHDDAAFVVLAYRTLLLREPDPEGYAYYLKRLRRGVGKLELILQLRSSTEARSKPVELPGLARALWSMHLVRLPVIGVLFRLFGMGDMRTPLARQLSRIEAKLAVLHRDSHRPADDHRPIINDGQPGTSPATPVDTSRLTARARSFLSRLQN
jgi:FkbM family methyltransferase